MALFTGSCSHVNGYVTASVPMPLPDARAFLLRELGRALAAEGYKA